MRGWFTALHSATALLAVAPLFAQSPESDLPEGHAETRTEDAHWVIPEVPDKWFDAIKIDTKFFTMHWGFCFIEDFTEFDQNANSISQVGKQDSGWDLRSGRLMLRGQIRFLGTWNYLVGGEYNGFDRDPGDPLWNLTDLWFSTRICEYFTLKVGKQKEPFVYEMVGDAANLPQAERFLSPFFTSRNVGVTLSGAYLHERATWSVGWFNDWWTKGQSFTNSGNDFAGRFTFLPIFASDNRQYLHFAV